ncbi:MAG: group III truncated hemoglobin [Polaribacter sp.]|nr:group III truncated hemoglobin [Polaribacter sp.]
MKQDILSRKDIKLIITEFYKKLVTDVEMLPFFEEIVKKNQLEAHLEVITDFWQDILLDTTSYRNNVLQKHLDFDKKIAFKTTHFEKWLAYLSSTINTFFEGQVAERMKNRAKSVATVMQLKMSLYNS